MDNVISMKNKITLEKRVEYDMRSMGYDPTKPKDVKEFWQDRFEEEPIILTTTYGGQEFLIEITPVMEEENDL
jgi:hypothetical protein